jgi:hypothetical protein
LEKGAGAFPEQFRIWLVRAEASPGGGPAGPLRAVEPAEPEPMSAKAAARYVAAFNQAAERLGEPLRAVALPVDLCYRGEPRPGEAVRVSRRLRRRRPVVAPSQNAGT